MKGQDHTIHQITVDPWIYILGLIVGLVSLFLFCTSRVAATLPADTLPDNKVKDTETLPANHKVPAKDSKLQSWFVDYSDISNERAGKQIDPRESPLWPTPFRPREKGEFLN